MLQASFSATEKYFGRGEKEEEENRPQQEEEVGEEEEVSIAYAEFRVFLQLLNQYFAYCRVRNGRRKKQDPGLNNQQVK